MKAKQKLDLLVNCPCGSKAGIFEGRAGYYCHCLHCGRLTFFKSDTLVERVRAGAKSICDHKVELKECKGGQTGWCPKCRARVFVPAA